MLSELRPVAGGRDLVRPLLDDRDADVRAAAWDTLVVLLGKPIDRAMAEPPPDDLEALIAKAMRDPEPQVRRAAIAAITEPGALIRLGNADDDGDVRTRALARTAERDGRAASADLLLARLAEAHPGSAERVRTALAWHLAR
jgi:HEAT repeat protein